MKHVLTREVAPGVVEQTIFRIIGYSVDQPYEVLFVGGTATRGPQSITIKGEVESVTLMPTPAKKKRIKR